MPAIKRIKPAKLISGAVVHGDTVYVSGQIADDTSQGVKGQTAQILAKIEALLQEAGSDKTKLLAVNIWIDDTRHFAEMNEAWLEWIDAAHLPARATVQARLARS
jgi:enamine deaminase RidA (YjgF/YER057c/UK114 family)